MKVAPQRRRNQSKPKSLTQASNVVDLHAWANDHDRIGIVHHIERVEEQRETDERRRRFDAEWRSWRRSKKSCSRPEHNPAALPKSVGGEGIGENRPPLSRILAKA